MLFFFAYNKTILSTATAIVRTKKNNFPTECSLVRGIGNFTTRQVLSFTLFNFASLAMSQYKAMNTSLSRFSLMCVLKWRLKTLFASILNHYMCVCVYCLVWESSRRSINDAIVEEAGEVQREDFPSERDGKNQYFYAQRVFLNYYPANTFFLWSSSLFMNSTSSCTCDNVYKQQNQVWLCVEVKLQMHRERCECVCMWLINQQTTRDNGARSKQERVYNRHSSRKPNEWMQTSRRLTVEVASMLRRRLAVHTFKRPASQTTGWCECNICMFMYLIVG